jgi:hypothetical protein
VIKKQPPVRKTPLTQEQTPRPSAQQFKATPRFNFSQTPRPTPSQTIPASTPSALRFTTPVRPDLQQEDIDDNSPNVSQDVYESIEVEDQDDDLGLLPVDAEDEYIIDEPSPKRRRFSSTSMLLDEEVHTPGHKKDNYNLHDPASSPIPILSSPERRPVSTAARRFLISTPAPQSTPQPTQATFLKPPRFRPPDPADASPSQAEPLPEQFSPHRRGQKYVAGGLAAEVRDWLVNIQSTVLVARTQDKDEPWLVKLVVDEISGGGRAGMTLLRGRRVHSGDLHGMIDTVGILKVILAGEGQGTGLQKGSKVEVGKTVGIKGPVWEAVVEGEQWGVGVDWKVL